ncbi:thioesterase family protein [Tumebacillus sp. ITR2]|uniref:Thioesterase family protein n=1 Tax=Tumebacillus amylolyticus TaxID=2801339 RepID=A0ABS1JB05_9BACL|nr:thioesterase family protein [Tumebacillus amylolyticus]MBL0387459.1 thioesterase family protein [Tumebacillus amylolyticus]
MSQKPVESGFHHPLVVRFHEVDSMQVVHHSMYLQWLEACRWAFARDVLDLTPTGFNELGFALPVVRAQLDYVEPATLESDILIVMHYILQEKVMVSFKYRVYDRTTGKLIMRARTDHAVMSVETRRLQIQWPDAWLAKTGRAVEQYPHYFAPDEKKPSRR